jgi:subtilisin family serine protease
MQEHEYIITLHRFEDLDSFYEDMETPGGNLYIPNRAIDVSERRPVSRNTHYRLTDEEAESIRTDPRVMAVELTLDAQGIIIEPSWTQSDTDWNKSASVSSSYKNWGLLRCVEGQQRPSWGLNGVTEVSGEINVTASGKNVDIVIVDGHMNPGHPEFAVNVDGSGGTRIKEFNWFSLNLLVRGSAPGTYVYTPYIDATYPDDNDDGYSDRTIDNDHGTHVAGIAAGNTQGWAHDSNIYNISPYSSSPSTTPFFLDYIKVWHQTKEVNPLTGVKNPTITNHSYAIVREVPISTIARVRYRGAIIDGPFTSSQLLGYGIYNTGGIAKISARNTAVEQDLIDLMNAGIIVIGAAGNLYSKISTETALVNDDYNNYIETTGLDYYFYLRGTITAVSGAICVGAIGASIDDSKLDFSNCGPRVDVYAPGRHIMSAVNSAIGVFSNETRDTLYRVSKKTGTSMASPQVAGIVACLAETWPTMKQSQVLTYVQSRAKTNQITAGRLGPRDYTDLQGSSNRFLYFYKERLDSGQVGPKLNLGNRPTSGQTWPRPKIYRYGR